MVDLFFHKSEDFVISAYKPIKTTHCAVEESSPLESGREQERRSALKVKDKAQ